MLLDDLQKMGLSRNESVVYNCLMELGPSCVAPIVRSTKKHRQIIYNALDALIEKNLVSVSKRNGKNLYNLTDPHQFLIDIDSKKIIAEDLVRKIEENIKDEDDKVQVFSGPDSFIQGTKHFRVKATEAEEFLVIRRETIDWFRSMGKEWTPHVNEVSKLKKSGITPMILFFDDEIYRVKKQMDPYINSPYVVKISKSFDKIPHTVWIAGDNIYILTPSTEPMVINVQNKILSERYRKYFWELWQNSKYYNDLLPSKNAHKAMKEEA